MPPLIDELWPPKPQAIMNLEQSLRDNRPRSLVQMATGSGKTLLAIVMAYRSLTKAQQARFDPMRQYWGKKATIKGIVHFRPSGKPRLVGADASHAWAAVWIPGPDPSQSGYWFAVDPTNDQWVDDRYVTVAWGREYGDVPPLKGVIHSDARKSTLKVEVEVAPAS